MSLTRRAALALVSIVAWSCADPASVQEAPDVWGLGAFFPTLNVLSELPAVCGQATVTPLTAGRTTPAGTVRITQDGASLYVVYQTEASWPIHKTAVFVGASAAGIPTNSSGNPRVGQFPHTSSHAGVHQVVWQVPMPPGAPPNVVVAAFAEVGAAPEGAWGEGPQITPGGSWAMYVGHEVSVCAGATIGAEGGTVALPGGGATLTIPGGALVGAMNITVEPATAANLPEGIEPAPIPGTIWDLGPDGLEFLTPATLVLTYDPEALPPGTNEQDLAIALYDGELERVPGVVDTDANTITAEISHFTFAWGYVDLTLDIDLEVTSFPVPTTSGAGVPLQLAAVVRNNGPDVAMDATLQYQVAGSVTLGPLAAGCEVVPSPSFGDVAILCSVPRLPSEETAEIAPLTVTPTLAGEVITARAVAFGSPYAHDTNFANNTAEILFGVGGTGGIVDLLAGGGESPDSDPRVGGLVQWVGRVDNLGPETSTGGSMVLSASGDIVLGPVPSSCVTLLDSPGVRVSIQCPVDPLEPHDIDLPGVLRFTPQSAGDIHLTATVTAAPGDTESNLENNARSVTLTVGTNYLVDLSPFGPRARGTGQPGDPLLFDVRVGNRRPPSQGGTLVYEATGGDVELSFVAPGCQAAPNPSAVAVFCTIDPFSGFANDTTGANSQRYPRWIGPFALISRSGDPITLTATTFTAAGDTDVNPSDDRIEVTLALGLRNVDLELVNLTADGNVVNQPVDVRVDVRNLGPDASRGAVLTYSLGGAGIVFGNVSGSCVADPATLVVRCEIPPLTVGQGDANARFQFIPQATGNVSVQAIVAPLYPQDLDLNFPNSFQQTTVTVVAGSE